MATYECSTCGMGVKTQCARCDTELVNDTITLDDGKIVQVAVCPEGHGKIKSPLCCGDDMTCKVA